METGMSSDYSFSGINLIPRLLKKIDLFVFKWRLKEFYLPVLRLCIDVEFNVSGMFAMPTPPSNHSMEYDCSTIEKKRPGSMVGPENDNPRKDR